MRLLLLAGTGEARQIAEALAPCADVQVTASLSGATRAPARLAVPTRVGGFGGRAGFVDWLRSEGITCVLDATHPFASRISHRTAEVCTELGLPHAHVLRPPWQAGPKDHWHPIAAESDAAGLIPSGTRVFIATGRQTLEGYANMTGRYLVCRQIDAPEGVFPLPEGEFLQGRPPFSVAQEVALFQRLAIDWLVVKNAGGAGSRSKLDAARQLGLPVAMIDRPAPPPGHTLETVKEALAWVTHLRRA